jgi:hypothetical protein
MENRELKTIDEEKAKFQAGAMAARLISNG